MKLIVTCTFKLNQPHFLSPVTGFKPSCLFQNFYLDTLFHSLCFFDSTFTSNFETKMKMQLFKRWIDLVYLFRQNAGDVDVFQMEKRNLNGSLEQGQRGAPRHQVCRAGQVIRVDLPVEHVVGTIPFVVWVADGYGAADQRTDQQVRFLVSYHLKRDEFETGNEMTDQFAKGCCYSNLFWKED